MVPCGKCQQRERRRVENIVADDRSGDGSSMSGNEVAPHSDSTSTSNEKNSQQSEDASRIVVFRNAPWKVKNKTVTVRLRVTCYSSHHNEDKGFECVKSILHFATLSEPQSCRLVFTLRDSQGRIVGRGTSPPILIVDGRRKAHGKRVPVARANKLRIVRERGINVRGPEVSSPECFHLEPLSLDHATSSQAGPSVQYLVPNPPAAPNNSSPLSECDSRQAHSWEDSALVRDPLMASVDTLNGIGLLTHLHIGAYSQPPAAEPLRPQIDSITPNSGSLNGGIEVIVLGENFRPYHKCVIGDTVAQTKWWNEGALKVIVPPSTVAGPIPVTIEGYPLPVGGGKDSGGVSTRQIPWFTYEDTLENDL